ncbi:type II toxin-antitoxin system RelB family antitoxin [Alkalilimnicola ehrlichii]|uniref:type II toxin-antitoxin system RelB family antitoxin n=1 Tax=Alkalilimnicola ehrlichii TaxID=351052 RepID=UPI003BA007C4
MDTRQTAVRLPTETYDRLKALAEQTGRTTAYYIREAIEDRLEDMEDIYLAERTLERVRSGEEDVIDAEEFWRDMED